MRTMPCVLALLALSVARPAFAAPVVLYGPGVDGAQATALAKDQLKISDFRVEGPLFDFIGAGGVAPVAVGATATPCRDPSLRQRALKGQMIRVRQGMKEMAYDGVIRDIDDVVMRLPCLAADAGRDEIYELFFSRGIARFFEGDEAGARQAFRQAATIDPSREWPIDYPPTPQPLYLDALRELLAQPPAALLVELEGGVIVDGIADDGKPRLLAGGHLFYAPSARSGLWIDLPQSKSLPEQGLLLTTAVQLANGLLRGEARYEPWLAARAAERSWDDVILVSEGWTVRWKGGAFTVLKSDAKELRAAARRSKVRHGPAPATLVGIATFAAGAGIGLGGLTLNLVTFDEGLPQEGSLLPARAQYEKWYRDNRGGVGLAVAGGATCIVGAALIVTGLVAPPPKVAVLPWVRGDRDGFALGLAGTLP